MSYDYRPTPDEVRAEADRIRAENLDAKRGQGPPKEPPPARRNRSLVTFRRRGGGDATAWIEGKEDRACR